MKIAVFGATGPTGRLVLAQGMQRGHMMTACTRRPQALDGVSGLHAIVAGDGRDRDTVMAAVREQDAVIAIISSPGLRPSTVVTEVARTIVTATAGSWHTATRLCEFALPGSDPSTPDFDSSEMDTAPSLRGFSRHGADSDRQPLRLGDCSRHPTDQWRGDWERSGDTKSTRFSDRTLSDTPGPIWRWSC